MQRMSIFWRPSLLILLAGALSAADLPLTPAAIEPGARVVRFAEAHRIDIHGFDLAGEGEPARPGDALTVLFTLIEAGSARRQWLAEIRMVPLTEREAKTKPGTGAGVLGFFQSSLKSDTGRRFSFDQEPVALEIRTHGPFAGQDPAAGDPTTVTARVLATRDFLAHGLAPMARIELRLRAAGKTNPGISLTFRDRYSDAQVAATRARAEEAGFTEDDERAYAKTIFALVQFGNLGFKTAGLDAITHGIADSPTLFSGAYTNLVWPEMQVEAGENWGLAGIRLFRVPYNFRSKTKAGGTFFITVARPPLQNMAGIVGLTVDSTSKAPGRRLIMRVLAGRRGAAPRPE